jgi:hypothetical protein
MRAVTASVAAVLVAISAACSGDRPDAAAAQGELPSITLEEELRIDGYEHDLVPIDTAVRVAVARDGRIIIAQQQDAELRFFSADGEPIGRLGRRGEGPAEFTNLWRLGWMGRDTLFAYDFSQRRFTLIDPDFQYVRYVHVPNGARPSPELADRLPEFSTVFGGALYADGSVYAQVAGPVSEPPSGYDPGLIVYGQVAEDGTILSAVQFTRESFFDTGLILKLADDGTRMVYLQSEVDGPNAGTFGVAVEEIGGDTLYARRYPFEIRPTDEAFLDSLNEAFGGEGIPESLEIPPMLPPFVAVLPGIDHSLWLQMRETPEGRPYRVHDAVGDPVGMLILPSNQKLAVASLERVWLLERDDFDVESVVRYRVVIGG